jgi:DNA-binding MarR family transcriptional regulator
VSPDIDSNVTQIEQAAFQLRRLWAKSQLLHRLREECGRGIQLSNLLVIYAVARQDDEGHDVTVGAVADYLDIDPSTASRLVGHAIDAGFVSRHVSPVDARRAHLRLTAAGRRVKEMTDEFRLRFIAELVADWTDAERDQFGRLLKRFADAVASFPVGPAHPEQILEAARRAED